MDWQKRANDATYIQDTTTRVKGSWSQAALCS